ncbi:MAG TPA: hypothetical protein PK592_02005 [Candidatus Cloacimonas sp.]|jgi:hypothetical protein|nr:hypothetical protein [Candidatus Cloacimonas sp.]MCK9165062.1 hypothetical protein [Candidatus Cloacimonas sp.]HPK59650.1 hypothetical protein [Candidatus Cloacimonas sp.]HRV10255.1 hypothetical protein [Candidatus Cloacimonas sp.]
MKTSIFLFFSRDYATIAMIVLVFELKSVLLVICHTISFFLLSLNKVINYLIENADFDLKPTGLQNVDFDLEPTDY